MGKPKYKVESGGSSIIAVRFAHGSLKEDVDRKKMSWNIYKKKLAASSKQKQAAMLAAAEVDGMTYRGVQEVGDVCDYYMGVLEPDSNTMKIHPAAFITMHPVMEDQDRTEDPSIAKDKDWRTKTDELAMEFGSGRMMKAVKRRKNDKLNEEMLSVTTQAGADTAMVDVLAAGGGMRPDQGATLTARPPHNMEAQRPEDVYKLSDIIPPDITPSLREMCQPMVQSTPEVIDAWVREKRYPSFIQSKLTNLSIQANVRLLQCQCLTYLNCLGHMFKLKASQIAVRHPLPPQWPQSVRSHMLGSFTQEGLDGKKKRTFPAVLKDKLLSHILVLCLKLSQHSLELNPLMADLGVASKKLNLHCKFLGCTIRQQANPENKSDIKFTAELKVPLKFPDEFKKKYGGK